MKIIIFHGTSCKPEDFWYSWLRDRLLDSGHSVELPYMPTINKTPIDEFLPEIINEFEYDENTILIGHSAGVPLILSILENTSIPISQAILVGGFSEPIGKDVDPILQLKYEWEKIKNNCQDFVIFNSPNDPWGCDDIQGRQLFDRLGGTLIIRNDGHFGSSKDPEYKEFPLLEKVIKERSS
jgi:predicted alpha/beta hydrolase family esterase